MTTLQLEDAQAGTDLATFVRRALRVSPDGAMRIQAIGSVLATWVEVLPGRSLTHAGLTLGLRVQRLAEEVEIDVAVPLVALRDRFAREEGSSISLPPQQVSASWLAITPPRSGWEAHEEIATESLRDAARLGVLEVADGTPPGAGAAAVAALRERVWGRRLNDDIPAGAAFAADALGFLVGDTATWHRHGPWGRLATPAGFVLTR
ncbi:hypothetical protein IEE94_02760 [Yimella sp. cx-573]|nr:hypothetical protein [Yimella sp. cx-573]